jgi:2-keto-4-pentenoate hydratase/2-oxohepta-3-ene-1,7-dioic acid hydratase in catechol pathway
LGVLNRVGFFFNTTTIVDVNLLWKAHFERKDFFGASVRADIHAPSKLSLILEQKENAIGFFQESLELFKNLSKAGILCTRDKGYFSFDLNDEKDVFLNKPLDRINCYRDFYIHEKHVKIGFEKRGEAVPEAWYEMPVFYKGPTTSFIGPEQTIPWPSFTKKLDYELELAAVIARHGTNIKAQNAYQHIFGFTILNDISARDIQKKEMSVRLGPSKGKDFCSVIGPVITTADEFNFEEPSLKMRAYINKELWSEGLSSDGHYSWAEMIEHLTRDEWVYPTDLLGSGTVGTGCGLELDKWIAPSDIVELEIEAIGILKNLIGIPLEKN